MSLGFKLYSFFNGNLVHQDSLGNKYYHDKKNFSNVVKIFEISVSISEILEEFISV